MDQGLKILILEDADHDAELIEYELGKLRLPFCVRRVVTREAFLEALGKFGPDLILADNRLPVFEGLTALALAQEECPEIPFIFVSGAMSPELSPKELRPGSAAFIPQDRLCRLPTEVERSLGQLNPASAPARSSRSHQDNCWSGLFQSTRNMMVVLSLERSILEFNQGAELLSGWQRREVLGRDLVELLVEKEKWPWVTDKMARVAAGEITRDFELSILSRSGAACRLLWRLSRLQDLQDQPAVILLVAEDLTSRLETSRTRTAKTFYVTSRLNLTC